MVGLLMSRGVHLCGKNLYNACASDTSPEIFQVFLDHGWDVNKPMKGVSPFMEAASKASLEIIQLLHLSGIPDYFFKWTAVDLAREHGTSKTIEMMRKNTVRRSKI
jgi:hypothetical protein